MRDFFDEFNREMNELFKLSHSFFNRPVKDMQPYHLVKVDNGYIVVINTLGIDKEDIMVELKTKQGSPYKYLHVSGKTKMEKINFENNVDLAIALHMGSDIVDLTYNIKNGLTVVFLKMSEPKVELEAKFVEDDAFDF
jgi:HSP20 family molecular chaperone IbpA